MSHDDPTAPGLGGELLPAASVASDLRDAAAPAGTERVEVADEVVDAPHGWHGPGGWQPREDSLRPRTTWRQAFEMLRLQVGGLAVIGFVAWLIAPGGLRGGWFWWSVLGVVLAPALLLGLAAIVIGFFWSRMMQREREREAARRAAAAATADGRDDGTAG